MIEFLKNNKIIFGICFTVLVAVLAIFMFNNSGIKEDDYEILGRSGSQVVVNKNIGNISNIEPILQDLSFNYSATNITISDSEIVIVLKRNHLMEYAWRYYANDGVYKNIGTARNPVKLKDIDDAKTKELNKFLEKYNG